LAARFLTAAPGRQTISIHVSHRCLA
jgi:hypothetical protein